LNHGNGKINLSKRALHESAFISLIHALMF
jgi:hypothetical protein